ncbi:precorrin-6y C5,15-methyltransferase (decarboxylating) subunit CbiE [Clostridium estertheticum]|uniref:precorrin-6y C5,15-methyltransferase (decarboxylating) subunit CbiE n=1 Tax=Clostridium estertheticum TaxID=238834 RepID=UPI001CD13DFA|nr:precorrin-6y C5,15-methyltransferase (decarboxylating) subunit CbiE [Clostridium estertheticum]MBZ9687083.1 precorrin-6y C5,15-methyltransferase (decarboxylating) subunit CbiE [Clostridium estertheticum]
MIKVVGMGPGNINYLTMEAINAIKSADRVIAFGRICSTAKVIVNSVIEVNRVDEIIENLDNKVNTAILASGDPCFFGIIDYLRKKGIVIGEVIPGISSFQYMMAKLKKSWQDALLISLHGRDEKLEGVVKSRLSVILTDKTNNPNFISKKLCELGVIGKIHTGYNLSYDEEVILINNIGDEIEIAGNISVVVIENEMA